MLPWTKDRRLKLAIDDWRERQIIDEQTCDTLLADIADSQSDRSFSAVLIMLAAVCIGFAAVSFVASNWEVMSRITKTSLLLGSMCAFWACAMWCYAKGHANIAHASILVACSLFGASIMLIAQMYHIQGRAENAVWLWAFGVMIAAGLTRSLPALCLSIALFFIWHMFTVFDEYTLHYAYLPYAMAGLALGFWMQSKLALHLSLIGLVFWTGTSSGHDLFVNTSATFAAVSISAGLFIIASSFILKDALTARRSFLPTIRFYAVALVFLLWGSWFLIQSEAAERPEHELFIALSHHVPWAYLLCGLIFASALWAWIKEHEHSYELAIASILSFSFLTFAPFAPDTMFVAEILSLACVLWVIRMGFRIGDRGIIFLGFVGFAGTMLMLYAVTVGTLIGTAGFYAVSGLVLLGLGVVSRKTLTEKGNFS